MEQRMNDQTVGSSFARGGADGAPRASRRPLDGCLSPLLDDGDFWRPRRKRELVDAGALAMVARKVNGLRKRIVYGGAARPLVNFATFAGLAALLCWCLA